MARTPSLKRFMCEATINVPDQWMAPLQKVVQSAEKSGRLPKDAGSWIVDKAPRTRRAADQLPASEPPASAEPASDQSKPTAPQSYTTKSGRSFPSTNRFLATPKPPEDVDPDASSRRPSEIPEPKQKKAPNDDGGQRSGRYDDDPMFAGFEPNKASDEPEDSSWLRSTKLGKAFAAFTGKLPKPKSANVKVRKPKKRRFGSVPDFDSDLAASYGVKKPEKPSFDKRAPLPNFDAMSEKPPTGRKSLYSLMGLEEPDEDESDNVKDIGKLFKKKSSPEAQDNFEDDEKTDVDFEEDEKTDTDAKKSKKESLLRYYAMNGRRKF